MSAAVNDGHELQVVFNAPECLCIIRNKVENIIWYLFTHNYIDSFEWCSILYYTSFVS